MSDKQVGDRVIVYDGGLILKGSIISIKLDTLRDAAFYEIKLGRDRNTFFISDDVFEYTKQNLSKLIKRVEDDIYYLKMDLDDIKKIREEL